MVRSVLTLLLAGVTLSISVPQDPSRDPSRRERKKSPSTPFIAKDSWMLTVEERIALRTNPELARERVRLDEIQQQKLRRGAEATTERSATLADAFDGRSHPELFLPHQVFDTLIDMAFMGSPRSREKIHEGFMRDVKRHGLPDDFWQRLEAVSMIYCADYRALEDLMATRRRQQNDADRLRITEVLDLKRIEACGSRADALAVARNEFGRERFDRFLYEVIAGGMFTVTDRLPDPKRLQWVEEGCR